ncbi:DUF7931 domain-containing protein [Silvimonas amylolytica]|uniref:DUF7931 domain-containing protein n=1 Tax=Silvimonas amylolytica TaxID=449663 RepID=A0ABQ2PHG2_9NEIS|nr:hypothetical protein [Silvimonas amylolytica]GGP24821.1 hypothetical protein GCM10010971_06400 [Silvimonas amylolytica]
MPAKFDTYKDYREQTLMLLQSAREGLIMYEHDFSACGFSDRAVAQALNDLLVRNPAAQVRLLARSADYIAAQCPLLLQLANVQSQRFTLHLANTDMPTLLTPFILADMQRFVRRCHFDWAKGETDDDAQEVTRLRQAFDLAWECSIPSSDWRRLDL